MRRILLTESWPNKSESRLTLVFLDLNTRRNLNYIAFRGVSLTSLKRDMKTAYFCMPI
jgi:hypothetical protein